MANVRTLQRSFAGGEVTPELYGRIDDVKYQTGLALCKNFIPKPQGPVENRAGFAFVRAVKDSTKKTRLIPFTYSSTQTMVIEVGAGYFRFHSMGLTLETAPGSGIPYEVANPYAEAELFDIHYAQSNDVLTLVHPNHPPRELRRLGATNWQLTNISFTPVITPPTTVTATPNAADSTYTYNYVVTAVAADGFNESSPSAVATCTNNVFATGRWNMISWSAVAGAAHYNVYKESGGLYGFIGQTDTLSIKDDNIAPDLSRTPPKYETVFNAPGEYPGAVSYFEQRRVFGGSINKPQNIWMTRSGTESAMAYSLPSRDDDRISFRIAAREANTIRHIVPLTHLLLLTSSTEWRVTSINSDAITPSTISVRPQSYIGASNVQPIIVNTNLLYVAERGGHVRELSFNWQAGGFITGDVSLRATHLFDGHNITDMAYAKAPVPLAWFIRDDGKLLGFTYVPEQQIGAWHWHDTDGMFESCCTVAEGEEDVLYVIVRRFINGAWVRYVERMASRMFVDQKDAFFVDSGLTYTGTPATTISGLEHLEGKEVSILAEGAVHPRRTVVGGSITLDHPTTKAHIGLPIRAELRTLPLAMQTDGAFGQGRAKNVNRAWLRVFRSGGIFVGPDETKLTEVKQRTTEPYGAPPVLKSEEVQLMVSPSWGEEGQVFVCQYDPLPLTISSLTLEVAVGG